MTDFEDIGINGLPTRFPVIPPWPEPQFSFWRIRKRAVIDWDYICDTCNEVHDTDQSEHEIDVLIESSTEEEAMKIFWDNCLPALPPDVDERDIEYGHEWEYNHVQLFDLPHDGEEESEDQYMRYVIKAPELF